MKKLFDQMDLDLEVSDKNPKPGIIQLLWSKKNYVLQWRLEDAYLSI
jgi:hypothetical protein